jgi:hydrogenase maturation protein HypF
MTMVAERLLAGGVVQGVGFRPFVYGLAQRFGLTGWVRNTSAGVEIHIEGAAITVAAFCESLPRDLPPRAMLARFERAPTQPTGALSFTILESVADPGAYQLVSPDIAICDDCRRELLDPRDRRHGYAFTNCTNCGPRFTIIEDLPYDRERTTMRRFTLCPDCRREYEDPADRRFHAEPNACPVCGPRLELVGRAETGEAVAAPHDAGGTGDAIERAAALLRGGALLAVKGLGGFHLACDATDEAAVRELKARKRRPYKPLAVMFGDLQQARRECVIDDVEARLLESPEHPIVLVGWRGDAGQQPVGGGERAPGRVVAEVAVNQRYLGVMLPYTPLHLLLTRAASRPLVMTSGNLAEEPIVKGWEEVDRLGRIPDWYLVHDRQIAARYDDSVALVRAGKPRLLRRSRGYAPFPVHLPRSLPQILACGAELKNSFCLTRDANAFVSQHIGDLENLETLEHFESSIEQYKRLFRLEPEAIAYDLHPEYLATKYALEQPLERIGVQHHHAHIAACMVENGRTEPVIGVSMDGLGYGSDGALWGGEFLICDLLGFERVAHLEYLRLRGGALATPRPARTALGYAQALLGVEGGDRAARLLAATLGEQEIAVVVQQVVAGVNAPLTSSAGRLFDAVSALAGVCGEVTYEGQAAIELEMLSRAGGEPYPFRIRGDVHIAQRPAGGGEAGAPQAAPAQIGLAPLFAAVLDDIEARREPGFVGSRLHATVAAMTVAVCRKLRDAGAPPVVALSGGVFQNRLLSDLCEAALQQGGFTVLSHSLVPPNDGGLALGQAAVAGYTLLRNRGRLD